MPQYGKRHPLEREGDILFVVGLFLADPKMDATTAARVLNERRAETARELARRRGLSDAEVEAAVKHAQLSPQMVRTDIRQALARARDAAAAGAAAFLDGQLADSQADVDRTYEVDEQVLADLERSRAEETTQTRGRADKPGAKVEPTELVTTTHRRAGDAALYAILLKNIDTRIKLREEMRLLRFGREMMAEAAGAAETLSQAWAGLVDATPEQARERALALYAREAANLTRAAELEAGPLPAELQRAQALRAAKIARRLEGLRHFIPLTRSEEGGGRHYQLDVLFVGGGEPPADPAPPAG